MEAREFVKQVLAEDPSPPSLTCRRYITVRVNCLGSKWWTEDLAAMARTGKVS